MEFPICAFGLGPISETGFWHPQRLASPGHPAKARADCKDGLEVESQATGNQNPDEQKGQCWSFSFAGVDVELFAGDLSWVPKEMDGPETEDGENMTVVYFVSSFGFQGSLG